MLIVWLVGLVLLVACTTSRTFFACYLPASRAATVDPIVALRNE